LLLFCLHIAFLKCRPRRVDLANPNSTLPGKEAISGQGSTRLFAVYRECVAPINWGFAAFTLGHATLSFLITDN
jgi:hypothetical protein